MQNLTRFAIKINSKLCAKGGSLSELYIFDIRNDNLQSFNREKNEASVPVFYADWTSVPVPRTSSVRGLDVGFIPPSAKGVALYGDSDEYTDEYNDEYTDEYLCRDFFVGFNFWSRLSFQISEFRVHWAPYSWFSLNTSHIDQSLLETRAWNVQGPVKF